jgi:uncharacterized membrane protein YkoI
MDSKRCSFARLATALLLGLTAAGAGQAGEPHDHDRARQALESGEILPLPAILQRVEREAPGQIMAVELERHDGQWIYEVKVLRTGGSLVKLKLDARDGTVIESRRRAAGAPHRPGEMP